jgi:SAM-dependent methyltransferase
MSSIEVFEQQYRERGIHAQRLYPNESLLQFLGSNYFGLTPIERAGIRILEIGCGSGANLWMIAKEGFDAFGCDGSQSAIKIAKEHLQNKWNVAADIRHGVFDQLPYDGSFFDAVCDVVSLQHTTIDESRQSFGEILRVLKTGGYFFSYRLSDASVMYHPRTGKWIDPATVMNVDDVSMPLHNNGQTSFWSPVLARMKYADAGFIDINVERVGRTYDNGAKYVEYLTIAARKPD